MNKYVFPKVKLFNFKPSFLSCKLFLTLMLLDVWNLLLQRPADMSFVAGLLLFFYLHMAITFGKDVKQAYLQEVLKEKGERDREREKKHG